MNCRPATFELEAAAAPPPTWTLVDHWVQLNNTNRHAEGRRLLEGALLYTPGDARLTCRLACALLALNKRRLWAKVLFRDANARSPEVLQEFISGLPSARRAAYEALLAPPDPPSDPGELSLLLGEEAVVAGEYEAGLRLFHQGIEQGSVACTFSLGLAHQFGRGIPRNDPEAVRLIRKAAEAGLPQAMHNLAVRLEAGTGVRQDAAAADRWYRKAAKGGVAISMANIGAALIRARDTTKQAEAFDWFRRSAEGECPRGMLFLSRSYLQGIGVPRDPAAGIGWLRKALELGEPDVKAMAATELEAALRRHPNLRQR